MAYVRITQNQTSYTNAYAVLNADGEAIRISADTVRVNIHWSIYTSASALSYADRALHLVDGANNTLGTFYIGGSWKKNTWYEQWQSMEVKISPNTGQSALHNVGVMVLGPGGHGRQTLTWDGTKETNTGTPAIQRTNLHFEAWDSTKPVLHRMLVADVTESTYAVFAYVSAKTLTKTQCAVWSIANGQDDLQWYDLNAGYWERFGQSYNYAVTVHRASHKHEYGVYANDVYISNNNGYAYGHRLAYLTPIVRFHGNGGTFGGERGVNIGTTVGVLPVSQRLGYTMRGWFTSVSGGSQIVPSTKIFDGLQGGYVDIYAQWTPNTYKLNYNSNGGSAVAAKSIIYDQPYGTLPTPTRQHHQFLGWFTAPVGGSGVSANTICKGDAKVYAQWKELFQYDRVVIYTAANTRKKAKPYIFNGSAWKGASTQEHTGVIWKKTKITPSDF